MKHRGSMNSSIDKNNKNKNNKSNSTNRSNVMKYKKKNNLSKKTNIPKKIREEVWLNYNGPCFEKKCNISWCNNKINVFNYHVGHDIPESKGGNLDILNLKPICSNCNLSMANNFTITEWNKIGMNERSKIKNLKFYLKLMGISMISITSYFLLILCNNNYHLIK